MARSTGCPRRKSAARSNRSNFPPKALKFFKIIFNPESHRLKIPTEFTRRHGLHLPNHVFLKAPSGPTFQVQLINSNGEIWLQKGWDEFKEYFSLDFGRLLIFQYDGSSYLHVIIFDMSSSEIEYPFDDMTDSEDTGSESEDDSVPVLEEPLKGKGKIVCDQTQDNDSVEFLDNRGQRKMSGTTVDKKTSMAYQRAKAFKNDNPNPNRPYFISLMQPSYVSALYLLTIPVSVVKENLPGKINYIELRVSDGNVWPVKCVIQAPNARICSGWKAFVEDNGLQLGDACVFEVTRSNKFVWDVTIFRN